MNTYRSFCLRPCNQCHVGHHKCTATAWCLLLAAGCHHSCIAPRRSQLHLHQGKTSSSSGRRALPLPLPLPRTTVATTGEPEMMRALRRHDPVEGRHGRRGSLRERDGISRSMSSSSRSSRSSSRAWMEGSHLSELVLARRPAGALARPLGLDDGGQPPLGGLGAPRRCIEHDLHLRLQIFTPRKARALQHAQLPAAVGIRRLDRGGFVRRLTCASRTAGSRWWTRRIVTAHRPPGPGLALHARSRRSGAPKEIPEEGKARASLKALRLAGAPELSPAVRSSGEAHV